MKRLPVILLLVVLIVFGLGLVHLMNLRFERGDSYPPYSSLRADPLGTKALFESLDSLVAARRNLRPLATLGEGSDTTLLWLGADAGQARFLREEYKQLETFVRTGGRLVMAFRPVPRRPLPNTFMSTRAARGGRGAARTNAPPMPSGPELEMFPGVPIGTQWNFELRYEELPKDDSRKPRPDLAYLHVTNEAPSSLPNALETHTTLVFDSLAPDWKVIYARVTGTNQPAVMVERQFGKGSVVLAADSYPFSNEAMLKAREPSLLSWCAGANRMVIFDEAHLGVRENPGIATLARKYRLHGLFASILILAALFIWKNAASFMPPHEEQLALDQGEVLEGKDSATGFVNLLRRSIPPADLLKVCLEQWNAHSATGRKPAPARLEAMQQIIDEQNALELRQQNPIQTYQRLSKILSKRTRNP